MIKYTFRWKRPIKIKFEEVQHWRKESALAQVTRLSGALLVAEERSWIKEEQKKE